MVCTIRVLSLDIRVVIKVLRYCIEEWLITLRKSVLSCI